MTARLTGASVRRVEDRRFLTGEAAFVADLDLPGLLHAVFVRSPHAFARVTGMDLGAARAASGIRAVFGAADLAEVLDELRPIAFDGLHAPDHSALAHAVVRFVGDPVAIVVATSRALAEDAAELVDVEYEPRPPVIDMDRAHDSDGGLLWPELGTNVMHRQEHCVGDPDRALRGAALVVRERFGQHRVANAPMECRGSIAHFDRAAGALHFTTGHQSPHQLRAQLAKALRLPLERVRVSSAHIGGSFGQKSGLAREDAALAAASVLLDAPVSWIETRNENLLAAGHAREERVEIEAGFDGEGHLLGLRVDLVLDLGAYPQVGYPANGYANLVRALLPAAYRVTDYSFRAELVVTNKATYVPYRGPWEVETFVRERTFDIAARRLGIDRTEIRRRNLLTPAELTRGSCLGVDLRSVNVAETLAVATELTREQHWSRLIDVARAEGRHVGMGLATYVEPAPVSPSLLRAMGVQAVARTQQEARIRIEPDGTLTVFTSQQPHGQGHETTLAQLAADALSVPLEHVRVVWGDTDVAPYNLVGTGGSRAATLASGAVLEASSEMRRRVLDLASEMLEIAPDDLELRAGTASPRDAPSRAVPLATVAPGLEASGIFLSEDGTWSQATHCCMVEFDAETGRVDILRYLVVEDCGPPINPAIVDGQIRGGVAQGVGAVFYEHAAYDDTGQPRATSFADYLIPSAAEIPRVDIHHVHAATDDPVPYRGVGEGGAIGSPAALVSAVEDAVRSFGVELTEQHLPPAVLLARCGLL
jgi:aerobic carbon-monoxide dehydrogenase large subunit